MGNQRRVAIVNRGEAAMRLIHAVRELNARDGPRRSRRSPCTPRASGTAMFVREADAGLRPRPGRPPGPTSTTPCWSARCARPAPTPPGSAGASSPRTRRSPSCASGSASPSSAPPPTRCAGSATRSTPSCWPSRSASRSRRGAAARSTTWTTPLRHAERIGYPLMLKAAAGGGGRGIRVVTSDDELADVFDRTRDEAQRAFGSDVVFLERLVTRRPARRGAGHRRRARHGVGARRARLLGPAAQPEADRGVRLPGAGRRAGPRAARRPPSGWSSRSATAARAPSSSSTSPTSAASPSSRSTPGCRSSTRSPR